ncbi:PAS domain S-box protein [Pedobacter sp. Leaf170]|uniref:PAS domain S-box protein n=1 Tax=Pedobacter sp. Leaf170 TaxID=2876558 RepID=UPI001E3BA789|nr:PAS domain S-box protein [Pedobacter sp. Leaf170]
MPDTIYSAIFNLLTEPSLILKISQNSVTVIDASLSFLNFFNLNRNEVIDKPFENTTSHYNLEANQLATLNRKLIDAVSSESAISLQFYSEERKSNWNFEFCKPHLSENECIVLLKLWVSSPEKDKIDLSGSIDEQTFKYLVQEGMDMIAVIDNIGNYVYVSPTSESILGLGSDFFIGKNALEFVHQDDLSTVESILLNLKPGDTITLAPFRFIDGKGNYRWIETVLTNLINEPSVLGIVANSRDVTERINYQNEILLANERYKYVTKATAEAIWDWDIATNSLYWGEGFSTLFGYSEAELKSYIDIWAVKIHPEDYHRVVKGLDDVIAKGSHHWKDEYRMMRNDGSYATVIDNGFVIFNTDGKAIRVVGAIQDISKRKAEEQQLELLESVVLNTTDSVVITRYNEEENPSNGVIYVNDAFTEMTGYTLEDVLKGSPRILEGPRTDHEEVLRITSELLEGRPVEATLINYKKNGDEFWTNFSVTPIADERGRYNRWISIQRDVTSTKIEAVRNNLLSEIGLLFNQHSDLKTIMYKVLSAISKCGNFCIAEVWLPDNEHNELALYSYIISDEQIAEFYDSTRSHRKAAKGEGLAGRVWNNGELVSWRLDSESGHIARLSAAKKAGLKKAFGLPMVDNGVLIGVLILAGREQHRLEGMAVLSNDFAEQLATEVSRKQLEQELTDIFTFAPDILAIINKNGYFTKINPAAGELLGYNEAELLKYPSRFFVHPDDRKQTLKIIKNLTVGGDSNNFENRFITKSGQTKWLSWTANAVSNEGSIFAVAKDITEKKVLEELLLKTNSLARVGSWEVDIINNWVFWSDVTREIHEAPSYFQPDIINNTDHFKAGHDRTLIERKFQECIEFGQPWDEEVEIETFKGNYKWVRTIGQAEIVNDKCIRIFGSVQDINDRKNAELLNQKIQREVAESEKRYSELFHFSPLPMWVYDYETLMFLDVNLAAENNYGYSRDEFLSMNLRDIRPDSELLYLEDTLSFTKYNKSLFHQGIFKHKTKSGDILDVDVKSNLMEYKGRKAKLVVATNITDQLKHISSIEQKNAQLKEIAWIQSHNVRAPLARIMALVQLIDMGKQQTKFTLDEIVEHIKQSANELDSIIKEISAKSDKAESEHYE